MTVPDDADRVMTAVRLGWFIAEVRGRNRPDAPPGAAERLPGPPGHALPLHVEQTPTELRIAAQGVLAAMARNLGVDGAGANHGSYTAAIEAQAEALAKARAGSTAALVAATDGAAAPDAAAAVPSTVAAVVSAAPGDPAAQWDALQELIFKFDEHIQDALALGPDTVANGYQLGRALAEPYWALNPAVDTDQSPAAWQFLLGSSRCNEIGRLAGRLGGYLHPYTAAAIAGSVQIWKHVAADKAWRSNAHGYLYRQMRTWYELVVMGQDPTTLVRPYALTRNHRMIMRALRIFWPEVLGIVVAAGALSGFVVLLGENKVNSVLNSALGLIAIAGFTTAGFLAKLKNGAQAMVTRLRQDVYTDLVAVAITTVPDMPSLPETRVPLLPSKRTRQNTQLVKMARERGITPVTPN